MRAAARALNCTHRTIRYNINSQKPLKGRYEFKLID